LLVRHLRPVFCGDFVGILLCCHLPVAWRVVAGGGVGRKGVWLAA
jgi:hypothetical protein